MNKKPQAKTAMNFESISQVDVPHGRNGKHKTIVTQLLDDLAQLEAGQALKVRISQLPDSKENVRSALNRATRLKGMNVATTTDANFLYVWKTDEEAKVEEVSKVK